jgi:hypothetical protein
MHYLQECFRADYTILAFARWDLRSEIIAPRIGGLWANMKDHAGVMTTQPQYPIDFECPNS